MDTSSSNCFREKAAPSSAERNLHGVGLFVKERDLAPERRILVVAAHPDDDILGCGGTIRRRAREGAEVRILILGEGITSRYDRRTDAPGEALRALHATAAKAGRVIGAQSVEVSDLPDNRFDSVPLLEIVKRVEDAVGRFRPDTIYTHHEGDLNVDHERTARAVLTAARPQKGNTIQRIYAFEVPSSTEWRGPRAEHAFLPSRYVGIRTTLAAKLSALKYYRSEMRPFPHPRSPSGIRALAAKRGMEAGLPLAEAFVVIRDIDAT
jgi:LmbE family N-acetylglucosaminyl deacetylase